MIPAISLVTAPDHLGADFAADLCYHVRVAEKAMEKFELLLILKPEMAEPEKAGAFAAETRELLGSLGGKVDSEETWGLRGLSYPIRKFLEGVHLVLTVTLPSSKVPELTSRLNLDPRLIRLLLTKLGA